VEDIDFRSPRGLDRALVRALAQDSSWVRQHQNLFLIGPTDPATLCCTSLNF